MTALSLLIVGWKGYRTHSAVLLSVLAALGTMAGMLPTASGQSLAVALAALAVTCSRFAQSDLAKKLDELLLANGVVTAPPPADPDPRPFPRVVGLLLIALLCLAQSGHAQERPPVLTSMSLSPETRSWFRNPDGSCVQCSIGMAGIHTNDINAASLLWDTPHGAAVRGGSWPSRVERYCDERGIKAWSVTANSVEETLPWMVWAAKTGRFAAIGAGQAHFQTLYGYEPRHERPWMVCNNNSTQRIDRYGEREFRQLHASSGPWVVILERASSDPPTPVKWWK